MLIKKEETLLYGLDKVDVILEKLVTELDADEEQGFEIKLIISEALHNAFQHGNKGDQTKPIYLRYHYSRGLLTIEIEDCGEEHHNITIPEEISDDMLMSEHGRGLYIIGSMSDEVYFTRNTIIMKKHIKARGK